MMEGAKVLYIVVVDEWESSENGRESFRYTRPVLQSTLQLMGCKARHAFKISRRVFELMISEAYSDDLLPKEVEGNTGKEDGFFAESSFLPAELPDPLEKEDKTKSIPFESYKRRTTAVIRRETFLGVVCEALAEYKYVGHNQMADLILACRIRERKTSVTILLCGTSGCGKSTLSSLLGSRLGITKVISTDSIRHMMRSFTDDKQNPLLWASTYHAGEHLDPVAVAEAETKRKAKKSTVISRSVSRDDVADGSTVEKSGMVELVSPKRMTIEGFKAQSEMVIDSLDRLITQWEENNESVIVEGVHLSLNFVTGMMKKHPSVIPFMIYISNEVKHLERFAVRAKYMTLDPEKNKYVKYIRNIRTIQEYLCKGADKHLVPKVNNTNVDKSVAAIHATVFSCLRRREAGERLYDPTRNTVALIDEEYRNQCVANSLSSKGMFQLIQRKGSSRHLMALLNIDGSVAKAWPVDSLDGNRKQLILGLGTENRIGSPMYGPLVIDKAESVNLQFGHFGISAWHKEGGTSLAGSVDGSKGDCIETGSKYQSSCCSSPRMSDGPAKEEDPSVHGSSDEEDDDLLEADSDEDLSDDNNKQADDDEIGSVDEESTKSDEEYNDLAMQDVVEENGYWSEDDVEPHDKIVRFSDDQAIHLKQNKYFNNLDLFFRTNNKNTTSEPLLLRWYKSTEKIDGRMSIPSSMRIIKRSLSIPAMGKHDSVISDPIPSGAPQRYCRANFT